VLNAKKELCKHHSDLDPTAKLAVACAPDRSKAHSSNQTMAPTRDGRKKNTYCRLREKGEGPAELSAYDRFCIWLTGASLDNSSLTGACAVCFAVCVAMQAPTRK
jgi:hypothetical protein